MKNLIVLLVLVLASLASQANDKGIVVKVNFENVTDKELEDGELFIVELDKIIEVTSTQPFELTLPKKGKYQFIFKSDDFTAYTYYPNRINDKSNILTIQLQNKSQQIMNDGVFSFPMTVDTIITDVQIANGTLNFILNGIDASIPKEYVLFKEKYGVGLVKENCALNPMSFRRAIENNQMIAGYLDEKFGDTWHNELESKPFGIK